MSHTTAALAKSQAKQESLKILIDEYNIHFQSADDDLPSNLQREYDVVQDIENATINENIRRSSKETQYRTMEIWEAVRSCAKNENNEDTWRHEVETKIFKPLKHHACSKCGKRLWKADVEFPIGKEVGRRRENLQKRRDKREKCACTPDGPLCSALSTRDPRLKHRVLEGLYSRHVQYEPDLARRAPAGIFPDLVVGLADSDNFRNVLRSPSENSRGKRVGDDIKSDLFASTGSINESGMIFPFLVLEAKRARAPDSWEDMQRQMALPAYEMLRMQTALVERSLPALMGEGLPKIWLVSFKAQIWKLYVATAERGPTGRYTTRIVKMWTGDVEDKDGALKLVLLVDCIFDWALEFYRFDIFDSLKSMVTQNANIRSACIAPSVSELPSSSGRVDISTDSDPCFENLESIPDEPRPTDVIKYKNGWVRDVRQILVSGGGLFITASNIAEIFDNFEHPDHAKRFARFIWAILSPNALLFHNEDILDRVREVWTGERDRRQHLSNSKIYLQLEDYAYIDIQWQLKKDLAFVAATEDSIPELFRRTMYVKRSLHEIEQSRRPNITEERILEDIRDSRSVDFAELNLQDAAERSRCRLGGRLDTSVPSCVKAFQEIFRMYQVGQREPSENFIKIWHHPGPIIATESPQPSLVIGTADYRDWLHVDRRNRTPQLCLFVPKNLSNWSSSQTAAALELIQKQDDSFDRTVLRGAYFSGYTQFDDNCGLTISPSDPLPDPISINDLGPTPESLIDKWLQELNNDAMSDSDSDNDRYSTDDLDHRGE
ncbi:uncharacterized protein DSM5745_09279 [Aspergillus mulundensis]|uniref:Uncharacterized protein n=1 Tax=Aspergillus mulundensis TaxID=1810919 RepID=A0A3D8R023_9EURO|nr:hypothetical protein DSM5745_09279 [Aspergillus mulundensis]RDW67413.1 hypothetical protein DSM5745_09279 [Aspergillus mulundensis]